MDGSAPNGVPANTTSKRTSPPHKKSRRNKKTAQV
jgi:hypothetical protein